MSAVRFCLLLLLSLRVVLRARCTHHCQKSGKDKSNVRMCATRDLLWGWLNVTNKTAVRAEKVMQNATVLRDHANKVGEKAKEALVVAKDVLDRLNKTDPEKAGTVVPAVKTLERVIDNLKTSCKEADKAEKNAKDSMDTAVNGYAHICVAANSISGKHDNGLIVHERALQRIGMIATDGDCSKEFFASKKLSDMAAKLDVMENLSKWKNEAMLLFDSTYREIAQSESTCHWTFNNGARKFHDVKDAIKDAVEKLEVVMKELHIFYLTLQEAEKNVTNATKKVDIVKNTMLGRFKRSGTALCGMLVRRVKMDAQLRTTAERLESTKQQVASKMDGIAHLLSDATGASEVQKSVEKAISQLLKSGPLSLSVKLLALRNISSANESVTHFKNIVSLSAKDAVRAKESTTEVENQMENNKKEFEHIRQQLIARLNETETNISSLTADECSRKFSEVLNRPWNVAFDCAMHVNETALLETENAIKKLEVQIELMQPKLTKIDSNMRNVNTTISNAAQFKENAKTAAANAVADVLRSLMKEVCASVAELDELRMDNNGFKGTARNLRNNVSVESRRAEAAWKRDSADPEMSQYIEDGFTYASRGVAVLEKQLLRIDAQYVKVTNELSEGLKITEGNGSKSYDVVVKFVRGINSNPAALSLPSVCSGDNIVELVQSLMEDRDAMLKNVSAIVSLGDLAAKVKERLTSAREQMRKVVSSAADAQAAVEEAIRRARDTHAGRGCTPLHRQLLSVLQGIW